MHTESRAQKRMTGALRTLKRGHGFIAGDDGRNYYIHWSGMRPETKDFRDLKERERLDFSVVPNAVKPDVPRAVDVFVIPHEQEQQEQEKPKERG